MKHYLPITLLMLTMASGLAVAADPPAQSAPTTPTSPLDPLGVGTDSKPIQTVGANTPNPADPGYTQLGSMFNLKLDRPKTQLSLYENSSYSVFTDRDKFGIVGTPNNRLIKTELAYSNGIAFRTLEPGVLTLNFIDKETEKKQYTVEVTILGDTRQLQSQLDKLYPRASIETIKIGDSVLLRGTTSKQEHIAEIIEIAEQFYPKALNQLKVTGAPVDQALPVQPQMTHGNKPTGWPSGITSPLKPIPAPPAITVQAIVLEIDWKKLKEAKIDLGNTIRTFANDPNQRGLGFQATKSPFLSVVVPGHTTDSILQLLTATKAVNVISRPVIRTLDGQSAEISIGEKKPLAEKKEIRHGRQVLETGYRKTIGTALKLTPKLDSHGGLKLKVFVRHNLRGDSFIATTPGGNEAPNIQTHIFDTVVELKVGQAAILTETAQVSTNQKNPSEGKGLMVILSPPVIGMKSKNVVWIPVTTLQWIPEQNKFANVVRMVPKPIQTKAGAKNGIHSDWHKPHSPPVPQPIGTPTYTDPTTDAQFKTQDLRQSVRALRSDVRALRQDVGRLLKILEKKETSWNELPRSDMTPAQPTTAAIHRRIKESKTDLLVFQASWSGAYQKMASLLDEQADLGYSIRRLDVDKNRELAKEFGVTSVPTIIAFANGKEDERLVGIMGKEALTRIVDKYASRRDTILKGIWQSSTRTPEHRLHQVLMKEVSLKSEKIPLVDVMRALTQSEGINTHIDSRGLEEEGVELKAPITIDVKEITLKSALNLILNPLNLAYQVRDQTLVITSQQRALGKMTAVTYPVADLVIPLSTAGPVPKYEVTSKDDKNAQSASSPVIDFDTLTETILSSVQPHSWENVGGPGSIRPYKLSLVIRQTSQAHQEIENLLAQLRRLQDSQVTVESRFLDNLPEGILKKLGIDFDSKKESNGPLGGIILTDQQTELLLQAAQNNDRSRLIQGSKVTLFNGQTGRVTNTFTAGGKRHPLKHTLYMQPVISADRRYVRLNLRVSDLKSPGTETRAYVNKVPDGKAMLIEIVQWDANKVGVPLSEKVPSASPVFKNSDAHQTKSRRFLLIRPRIIVQEEEEEAILAPLPKLKTMLMLTPRGVIPEEEEKLLGIEQPE